MQLRTAYFATYAAIWQSVAQAVPSCSIASFQNVLPGNATILSAVAVANGSTYGEGAADIAYPSSLSTAPLAKFTKKLLTPAQQQTQPTFPQIALWSST